MSDEVAAAQEFERSLIGSVVSGKYRIDRLLGRGGMGAVFQATHLTIGKRVALKFLNRDAAGDRDAAERFQREALAASVVESSHIVQIFDSGVSEDGLPFLVMELLGGEDLRARLKREERLSVEAACSIAAQVLRALVRAHAAGLVHRDLKPDNVFLGQRDDAALFVKIVDFGVSKLSRGSTLNTLTRRGTVLGTAYYMSPEQAQAFPDIDGRTDLFSVGAILYECLAGRPPHVAPTYEAVLIAICTKDPDDLRSLAPAVPRALADVVHRALARDRDQRFASAKAMLDALNEAVPDALAPRSDSLTSHSGASFVSGTQAVDVGPFASTSRAELSGRRRSVRTIAMGAVALLAGFALTALWVGGRNTVATGPAAASALPSDHAALTPSLLEAKRPAQAGSQSAPLASSTTQSSALPNPRASASAFGGSPHKGRVTAHPRNAAGVAQGLELSDREP